MPSPGLRVLPLPALVCMEKHWRLLISISLLLWLPTRVRAEEEKTLAMIKPDGLLGGYKDKIKSILLDSGFHILKEMTLQLDEDKASLFYSERSEKSYFPSLVKYMTRGCRSGSILVGDSFTAISWASQGFSAAETAAMD